MSYSISTASPFLGGLNTELNKLVDSTNFTSDELNCIIRQNNTRSRRPGIDYEELYKFNDGYIPVQKQNLAFNCIEWIDINSPDEAVAYDQKPYLVVQIGGTIIFYENQGQPYSGHQIPFQLDLSTYALDSTTEDYMTERCKFTTAYGCLFITSKAIKPIMLRAAQEDSEEYHPSTEVPKGRLDVSFINASFNGVRASGEFYCQLYINNIPVTSQLTLSDLGVSYAPTSGQLADVFNALPALTRKNITATGKYDSTVLPVSNGIPGDTGGGGYRPEDYIDFEAPAGSGIALRDTKISIFVHYKYRSSTVANRTQEYTTETALTGGSVYHQQQGLHLMIRDTSTGATDYLEASETPEVMSYAHLYNLLNQGWTPKLLAAFYAGTTPHAFPGNNLAQQYLKDSSTSAFQPTALANMTFGNTPAPRGNRRLYYFDQERVHESNLVEAFSNLVSEIVSKGVSVDFEDIVDTNWDLEDPTQPNEADALSQVPNYIPRHQYCADICAYAGRLFYLTGDVLLYSQVIAEDVTRASYCYTDADPTSEILSDVIDTDGGLISLPEIGEGLKLAQVGPSLIVFGTKGNMVISGTANNIFTATAYSAGSINAVPTSAPDSFVETELGVFYWGTTGIQLVGAGESGLAVKDLSTEKILTFFGKISQVQHKYCKGVYSSSKKKVYWFYPSDENKPRRLDLAIVYDIQRDAFMPYKMTSQSGYETNLPEIVSGMKLRVPFKSVKEYPIYADVIIPDDTLELQYIKAVPTDSSEDITYNFTGDVDPMGHAQGDIVGNKVFRNNTDFDLVIKVLVNDIQGVAGIQPPAPVFISGSLQIDKVSGVIKLRTYAKPGHTAVSAELPYIGFPTWIRITNDSDTDTTTVKVLRDAIEEYTFETIGDATGWVDVFDNVDLAYTITGSDYKWKVQPKVTLDGYFDLSEAGDLESGWRFIERDSAPTIYYNPFTSDRAYSDSALTTDVGPLSDYYNGYQYLRTGYYTWLRQARGVPSTRVSKPWKGSDGDMVEIFMDSSVANNYVNNTATVIGDENLSSDVDGMELLPINGIFKYTANVLTPLNVTDPQVKQYTVTYSGIDTGSQEIQTDDGFKVLADDPLDTEEFTYESSVLLCLDITTGKVTFGDFINNNYKDWAEGDFDGDGYMFDSYLISHPANANDFVRNKTMPYLISYFKRTEVGKDLTGQYLYPTRCQGSVLWDWRTDGDNGKWDKPNELYRPRERTLLSEGYIITKTNIRGIGRSFQVRLHSVENNNFVIESLGFNLQHDERI